MTAVHRPRVMRWLGLIALAWCVILLLRATPIGGDWLPIPVSAWVTLLGWLAAYALGFTLYLHVAAAPPAIVVQQVPLVWSIRWIRRLCLFATVGAGLIVVEFAIVRGYGFTTPVALIRVAEVEGAMSGFGGSAISGAGRLLTPALQVAWILAVVRWSDLRAGTKFLMLFTTLLVLWQQAMYEGGRFFLATLVAGGFVARAMIVPSTRTRARPLISIRTGIIATVVMVAFGLVFLDRAASLELDLTTAYLIYTRGFAVTVGPDVTAHLDGAAGPLWFAASMFWMYITQGPNELAVLLDQEAFVHAFGLFQFPQVGQLLSRVTGSAMSYDVFSYLDNAGVYATSVGAGYVDFGVTGALVFALVSGALTAAAVRAIDAGRLNSLGLMAPLLVVLGMFSPIISLVTNLWPAMLWAVVVGMTAVRRSPVTASERDTCQTT